MTTPAPPRRELLELLRARLSDALPASRIIAQDILGADAPIDFVVVEPQGRTLVVLVGESGQDLELIGLALAQRSWLAIRLGDWLQIAPDLGARPEAGVGACVICPNFGGTALTAARALGSEAIRLVRYQTVRNGSGIGVLLERAPLEAEAAPHDAPFHPTAEQPPTAPSDPYEAVGDVLQQSTDAPETRTGSAEGEVHPREAPQAISTPAFRTGLSDDDLGLTREERSEFE